VSASSTIAAIATPPGVGAIAIVRLSGPDARAIVRRLLPERAGRRLEAGHARIQASFHDPVTGETIDRGLVHVFSGPRSFTGEDVVELHGHGGRVAPARVLAAALAAGAHPAPPGEFTRRALLNGKLDLLQAEALLDLIEAPAEGLHRQAVYQLAGSLSRSIADLRRRLVEVMALFELQIDFPEEDLEIPPDLVWRVRGVRDQLEALHGTYADGGVLRHGLRVVIAGLPNVGKSSLFNCLLGEERAIVTAQPGTTRDPIEAELAVGGIVLRLVDTAGLREARDEVETAGVALAHRHLEGAQVVLVVLDGTREPGEEEIQLLGDVATRPHVVAVSKCDLLDAYARQHLGAYNISSRNGASSPDKSNGSVAIATSARTGEGRAAVTAALLQAGTRDVRFGPETPVLTRLRQRNLTGRALACIDAGLAELAHAAAAPEKVAADLQEAARMLAELLGEVTSEDVLDEIFSQYCIGK
jgi:tRNA modification GTPase